MTPRGSLAPIGYAVADGWHGCLAVHEALPPVAVSASTRSSRGSSSLATCSAKTCHGWTRSCAPSVPSACRLAAQLVQLRVEVIVAVVTQASLAAKNATSTIPIVMLGVGDRLGLALSPVSRARAAT